MRYIFRAIDTSIAELTKDAREFIKSPVDLSKIQHSFYVVGLCLTYHINYGLSSRQVASILHDVHQLEISHQTVDNYCKAVSPLVHPVLENYPYKLSNTIAGDETYIKVMGKMTYIFFMFDAVNKIITSYRAFAKRDSLSAIKAVFSTISKYVKLPDGFKIITDGNPIYNVAQHFFAANDINFDLFQVIGLKNNTETDKTYRSEKQIIERLNRTLKYFYRPKGGFTSVDSANAYLVLFATCFNFLRPHSSLKYKVPVQDPYILGASDMPSKWINLINLGNNYRTNLT
jgi:transposase-like protein